MEILMDLMWLACKIGFGGLFVLCLIAMALDNDSGYVRPEDSFYEISNRKDKI